MTKNENKQLTHRDSRMKANNINRPYDALDEFFSSFSLEDCRHHLWELYTRCVLSYTGEGTEHDEATTILFFYTHTEMLVEAAWLINNKRRRKREQKKNKDTH